MKNILLLIVILALGVVAFIYYRKKTSNGNSVDSIKPIIDATSIGMDAGVTGTRGAFL